MKTSIYTILSAALIVGCSSTPKNKVAEDNAPRLVKLASFTGAQVTGVTATHDGRLFANFPRWRDNLPFSVVEVMPDGSYKPYPNEAWNEYDGTPKKYKFTCVQSVVAHGDDLYVLDPSNPEMKGVVGQPHLYRFDLKTNKLSRSWSFGTAEAPKNSYLNDLRITDDKIFITDSGAGALVVIDRATNEISRKLADSPSTKAEPVDVTVDGNTIPMKINADGIAYNESEDKIYYHSVTGNTLYRVPTSSIKDAEVENLGATPKPDGMIFDKRGNLYMADVENHSIVYRTPKGEIKTLIQDSSIGWADTFSIRGNDLIFTNSRLNDTKIGEDVGDKDFAIYKVPLAL